MIVTYFYDATSILVWTLRSIKGSDLIEAIKATHQYLELRGCKPNHQTLDNESSTLLRDYLNKNGMSFHFVPPHMNCRNVVERAIRTFKTHFIVILCGVDPGFPLFL